MSRIFMSHSNLDSRQAVALKQWLVEQEPPLANEIFLDIDARTGLQPGDRWKAALQQANARCEAVICLLSNNWAQSAECRVEYRLAENLHKQVLCARLEESAADAMTSEWQRCDLFGGERLTSVDIGQGPPVQFATDGLYRLREAVRGAGIGAQSFVWPPPGDPGRAPYRGWEPFEPEDAAVFFGRDAAIVHALDDLRGMRHAGVKSLFVVLGPSGAGKSSFLRAGILPRLAREDRQFVMLGVVRPSRTPLTGDTGLSAAIWESRRKFGLIEPSLGAIKAAVADDTSAVRDLLAGIQQAAASRLPAEDTATSTPPTLILPLDQAEELFSADAGDQAAQFISLISALARSGLELIVVSTIRTDRYEIMQAHPELAPLQTQVFDDLKPMPASQFKEVITGPAERATQAGSPLAIAPDLVDLLITETARGADTLPLLSLTMAELYTDYASTRTLTVDQYESMGGMYRVVQNAIDSILSAEPNRRREQLEALRAAFIPWLATINPDNDQPMRRVARWTDIPEQSRPLIDALVEKRLMVKDIRDGEAVVEVALESLLRQWDELAGWLRDRRNELLAADDLERSAAAWRNADGDPAWLISGTRLVDAESLITKPGFRERLISVNDFLTVAREHEDERVRIDEERREADLRAAQERQALAEAHGATLRKRSRITVIVAVIAVVVAVAAAVGFVQASHARSDAQQRFREASSTRITGEARDILASDTGDQVRAYQMILAAAAIAPTAAAENALYGAVVSNLRTLRLESISEPILAVAPDASRIATLADESSVRLRDARTGQPVGNVLPIDGDTVAGVVFGPDAAHLAVMGANAMQLWDIVGGEPVRASDEPIPTTDVGCCVAYSSDGKRVAISSSHRLGFFDAATGHRISTPLNDRPVPTGQMALSPDGTRLATTTFDAIEIWDLRTGEPIGKHATGHSDRVRDIVFSPNGAYVATSGGYTVQVWDSTTAAPADEPLQANATALAFSPDSTRIALGSDDGKASLWYAQTGLLEGDPFGGHTKAVTGLAFDPDGTRLIATGSDRTVREFDLTRQIVDNPLSPTVNSLAYSPDGTRLAIASDDAVRIWDTTNDKLVEKQLVGKTDRVDSVAFSPDAKLLATSDLGGVRLWNTETGQLVDEPIGSSGVHGVAFSPAGTLLAVAVDNTVRLWDTATKTFVGDPFALEGRDTVYNMAFSADGTRLATGDNNGNLRLWDTATRQQIDNLRTGPDDPVRAVAFSPDGTRLASTSLNTVRLWDTSSGDQIGDPLTGHNGLVFSVAFSPDGTRLVSAGEDATVRIWDPLTGHAIGDPLEGHRSSVATLAYSPDGNHFISGGLHGSVRKWPARVSPQDLCAKLTTNMTDKQWDEWVSPDIDYIKTCPNLPVPTG
jgi:WD40 repeat protein